MSALEAFKFNVEPSANWMDDAVCKGRTKLFFAPKAERPQARVRREAQARLLCRKPSHEYETLLGYTAEPEMVHRDNMILSR